MPIFLLIVGVLLVVVAINNKLPELKELITDDFTNNGGQAGFAVWILAIFVIGAIGYAKPLKPVANALLVLIVIVMLLSNKGFASKLSETFKGIR